MQKGYAIDATRVYVAGKSAGAMMAHRTAIEMSSRVAAIGVIGQWTYWNADKMAARPTPLPAAKSPVAVVMLQGEQDQFCGTPGRTSSQDEVFDYWTGASANSCASVTPATNMCNGSAQSDIAFKAGNACRGGADVRLYKLIGGDHVWYNQAMNIAWMQPFNPALDPASGVKTNDIFWNFFAFHPKQ